MRGARVRVPASAANLGPGYDSFGLALAVYDVFEARPSSEWSVTVLGEGEGVLPADASNPVIAAMMAVLDRVGVDARYSVTCHNGIPLGSGLGSSAAACVGGLLLADSAVGSHLSRAALLEMAGDMEGHPDNAAAALHGGLTVCWKGPSGVACARIEPAGGLAAVVVPGSGPVPTSDSRELLPQTVPHSDAAANSARAGLLVAGVALGRPEMLAAGLEDLIHERYRETVVPDLQDVREALVLAGADGAVLSGAGPAVIGLVHAADDAAALVRAAEIAARAGHALGGRPSPVAVAVDRVGAGVC